MKLALVVGLALGTGVGMASCDKFWGVKKDPVTGEVVKEQGSTSDAAGGLLGMFFPWAAAAVSAAGNVYLEVRRRNWKGAAVSTVTGLEEFFETPEGARVKSKAIELLSKKHAETVGKVVNVAKTIDSVLHPKK
jgi:hypothetical protein